MTLLDSLKKMGHKAVDLANEQLKNGIKEFSNASVDLERQYRILYMFRQLYLSKKIPFPHEAVFKRASDAITKERKGRLLLLKAMGLTNANPLDYGLQVYGLKKDDIVNAYPSLKFNVNELQVIPLVMIDAAAVLGVLALTAYVVSSYKEIKELNMLNVGTEYYIKAGYTPEAARAAAKKDIDDVTKKEDRGMFADLSDAAKYGAIAVSGYLLYKHFNKG
jgi:hypothetical protein